MSQYAPKEFDYNLPEEIDRQVRSTLPELFDDTHQSVLYIGANHLRSHFLSEFIKGCTKVTILEIFEDNVRHLREKYTEPHVEIVQGDVRMAAELLSEKFDVCFFWHGPEHLHENEISRVIGMLEKITKKLVVLGMPYGHYEQGSEYGNDHETHLWDIYPEDMDKLGYSADTLGKPDDSLANMMAWKYLE